MEFSLDKDSIFGSPSLSFGPNLDVVTAEHVIKCRFVQDPRRPYISRAVSRVLEKTLFLKRYDISVWSGTMKWLDQLMFRCALIERIADFGKSRTGISVSRGQRFQ